MTPVELETVTSNLVVLSQVNHGGGPSHMLIAMDMAQWRKLCADVELQLLEQQAKDALSEYTESDQTY